MNIKKNYFNNKSLPKNIYIINSQANQKIPKRNIGYSDKNFYQISLPNHSLNFQQNTLLHSEQSTLLTSEDFHNNNVVQQLKRRNNCLCFCHKIVETIKNSNNNVHIVNCHNPEIHCHTHCFNHIKNNQYYRPIHYSIETGHNANLRKSKNFELVYNYEKIKKHYNIIRPGCYHNRNERYKTNNYTKDPSYSRNTCFLDNNYTHKRFNKSCDDIEFNYKNSHDFLVRKTRKILGFPSFDLSSKNRYVNYKPNSVKYRNEDNKIPLYVNASQNKPNKVKNELNKKSKEKEAPNFANFTFKGNNIEIDDNNRYNQIFNNQSIDNMNNFNNKEQNIDNLIEEQINSEKQSLNKKKNNDRDKYNLIKNNFNNQRNNDIMRSNSKPHNINYNNDYDENFNDDIPFGNKQNKDNHKYKYNHTYSNKLSKQIHDNNSFNNDKNKNNKRKNEPNNNNNIDINRDIKDILKERNVFLKIKKMKKGKNENNLDNNINTKDDIDTNEKIIKDILNNKVNNEKNNNNQKKKKNNPKYLDFKNNTIDDIIEKILQKNHGKKNESMYKRQTNEKRNKEQNNNKIKYSNGIKDKKDKKYEIAKNIGGKDYKSFKDLNKQKQPNNTNNDIKKINQKQQNKKNKKEAKTPIKNKKDIHQIINKIRNVKDTNNLNQNKKNNKINNITKNPINKNDTKNNINNNLEKTRDKNGKNNKRSLSTNNIEKKINKGYKYTFKKQKKNDKNKNQNKNFPFLDIFHLNKINKFIHDNRNKNSILYNKIIQPYNNTKTLKNNNIPYKQSEIEQLDDNNNVLENINTNEKDNNNIIKEKKEIFNLSVPDKDKRLKSSKSCILGNRYNLGNIQNLTRNQSENFGNCFACYFGCAVSLSGYSPMNYSPYDGRRREENLAIPSDILYQVVKNNN